MTALLEQNVQQHEKITWKCVWTLDKFHGKDTEDLQHVVEHYGADEKWHDSPVLRGQGEVRDYLAFLLRAGFDDVLRRLALRPKAHCITTPDEHEIIPGNLLVYGGASNLWECLIGNGTGTAAQTLTYFNNANAAIGVGDSSTAAAATQTDLQASVNKLRVGMNGGYPSHTDGVTSGAATITWQSTFGSSQGNYTWAEAGIFNCSTAATGRMLNRLVQALGQKSSGSAWSIGGQITLS